MTEPTPPEGYSFLTGGARNARWTNPIEGWLDWPTDAEMVVLTCDVCGCFVVTELAGLHSSSHPA